MQHLQENTYNFNFKPEIMTIALNYFVERVERSSPAQVVDGLPDVINRVEDNAEGDEVICAICYEKFGNGETAKQLQCNHLYHSHCILSWFSHNISCPTCRHEPLSPQRWAALWRYSISLFLGTICTGSLIRTVSWILSNIVALVWQASSLHCS